MTDTWGELTRFSISLFALINPFTALPYVLVVGAAVGTRGIWTLAAASTVTMIFVLLGVHIVGEAALITLGTSLPSFQIGGGLVMLLSGLTMLNPPDSNAAPPTGVVISSGLAPLVKMGVAPLGVPMLAGAGSITKVIIETQPHYGMEDNLLLGVAITLVCLVSGAVIAASSVLMRLLGPAFFSILGRFSGLVIVAVAVEVMSRGLFAHVRNFAAG